MAQVFGGKWRHVRDLPAGGQAHTFEVRNEKDPTDSTRYALKRLKNVKRLPRFKREVEVISRLNHPHVIKIVDSDLETDRPYLVSEFCPGGSLADIPLQDFSIQQLLSLFHDVARATCVAHENGIT